MRNQHGMSGIWIIVLLLIPASIGIAAFAVDMVHIGTTNSSLLKACDAAALSGAAEVQDALSPEGMSRIESASRAVARLNVADGAAVESNPEAGVQVDVDVTPPDFAAGELGKVRVSASKKVHNLFGAVFGRPTDTVKVSSLAGPTAELTGMSAGRWFPLGVSFNLPNRSGELLQNKILNDAFALDGHKKGSQVSINAWPLIKGSGGSGKKLYSRLSQFLGIDDFISKKSDPKTIEPVQRGDLVDLHKGSKFVKWLKRDDVQTALKEKILYLPVVQNPVSKSGKIKGKDVPVVGFVGFKVTSIIVDLSKKDWSLAGNIVKGEQFGKIDPSVSPILPAPEQAKMTSLGVVAVKLLQ